MNEKIKAWTAHKMAADVCLALDKLAKDEDIQKIAVMPDVHIANEFCVGSVIASKNRLYPNAVGGDIGCGMSTVRLSMRADQLRKGNKAAALLKRLYQRVPKTKRPKEDLFEVPNELLESVEASIPELKSSLLSDGLHQLGTIGGGNHFLEFQSDSEGSLWVMLHTGSRGFGQALRDYFLPHTMKSEYGILYLQKDTAIGQKYLRVNEIGCAYAVLNRKLILDTVAEEMEQVFGCFIDAGTHFDCHHNYVRPENHFGREFMVHRKGALSAREGEKGLVPGSMGTPSYHVLGRGCEEALQSCAHGAGRRMSRGQARQRISRNDFKKAMGKIHFDEQRAAELVDEAPQAYKNITDVMEAQKELARIIREVKPVLSYKG